MENKILVRNGMLLYSKVIHDAVKYRSVTARRSDHKNEVQTKMRGIKRVGPKATGTARLTRV